MREQMVCGWWTIVKFLLLFICGCIIPHSFLLAWEAFSLAFERAKGGSDRGPKTEYLPADVDMDFLVVAMKCIRIDRAYLI